VNQRSRNNRQLFHANGLAAWAADAGDGTDAKYVAVFNTSDRGVHGLEAGIAVPVRLAELGFEGDVVAIDVWTGQRVGIFSGEFTPLVPFHGAGLYRLELAK